MSVNQGGECPSDDLTFPWKKLSLAPVSLALVTIPHKPLP